MEPPARWTGTEYVLGPIKVIDRRAPVAFGGEETERISVNSGEFQSIDPLAFVSAAGAAKGDFSPKRSASRLMCGLIVTDASC